MRHTRAQTPAYLVWVEHRPSNSRTGKASYFKAVKAAATAEIGEPIATNDIEIEIVYSTTRKAGERLDADNVNKPTLDALQGVAYTDDAQVRSATATVFDRNVNHVVHGKVERMGRLFYSPHPDVVLIMVYSDVRLAELGGEQEVQRKRYETWQRDFEHTLALIKENPANSAVAAAPPRALEGQCMTWRLVAKLLIAAPLVVLLVHYGTEFLAVDTCLDSGGVYDYAQGRCRTDAQTVPDVPYIARHRALLASLVVTILGGVAMFVLTRRKPAL